MNDWDDFNDLPHRPSSDGDTGDLFDWLDEEDETELDVPNQLSDSDDVLNWMANADVDADEAADDWLSQLSNLGAHTDDDEARWLPESDTDSAATDDSDTDFLNQLSAGAGATSDDTDLLNQLSSGEEDSLSTDLLNSLASGNTGDDFDTADETSASAGDELDWDALFGEDDAASLASEPAADDSDSGWGFADDALDSGDLTADTERESADSVWNLDEPSADADAEQTTADAVPSWLADMDISPAAAAEAATEELPPWLVDTDASAEETADEDIADIAQQQSAIMDAADAIHQDADWLAEFEDEAASVPEPGDVPGFADLPGTSPQAQADDTLADLLGDADDVSVDELAALLDDDDAELSEAELLALLEGGDVDDADINALLSQVEAGGGESLADTLAELEQGSITEAADLEAMDLESLFDPSEAAEAAATPDEPIEELAPAADDDFAVDAMLDDLFAETDLDAIEFEDAWDDDPIGLDDAPVVLDDDELEQLDALFAQDRAPAASDRPDNVKEVDFDTLFDEVDNEPLTPMPSTPSALEDDDEQVDWFAEEAPAEAEKLGWLDTIDENAAQASAEDSSLWQEAVDSAEARQKAERASAADLDDLLDSFAIDEGDFGPPQRAPADLDAAFDEYDDGEPQPALSDGDAPIQGEVPEWLRQAARSASASAVVRQREDRSLDELDSRLLELRERGLELSDTTGEDAASAQRLKALAPRVQDGLAPAQAAYTAATDLVARPVLTDEQQQRSEVLRALVGAGTGISPLIEDIDIGIDEEPLTAAAATVEPEENIFRQIPYLRLLVSLVLLGAVLLPFLGISLNLGDELALTFEDASPKWNAFIRIETLAPNDRVLFAVEYGATGARELDDMTRTLLAHTLSSAAQPVITSSNAVGLLHAENIVDDLVGSEARNERYVVTRFLPGGNLGLRDLAINSRQTFAVGSQGEETNLNIDSLDEFALIVLISESADTVRSWMEQVLPQTNSRVVVATGQAAAPLARAYVGNPEAADNQVISMLVGFADAFTYSRLAAERNGGLIEELDEDAHDSEANLNPAARFARVNLDKSGQPLQYAGDDRFEIVPPRDLQQANDPEDELITVGRNITENDVDVYLQPGSTIVLLGQVEPEEEFIVLEEAGEFTRIRTQDGDDGWVRSDTIATEQRPRRDVDFAPTVTPTATRRAQSADADDNPAATSTPLFQDTQATDDDSAEREDEADEDDAAIIPQVVADAPNRSAATTIGTLLAIVVIAVGSIYWIIRWLQRGGQ